MIIADEAIYAGLKKLGRMIEEKSAELRLSQNKLTELCLQRYLPEMRMWT